jgi:hypothetical protein
MSVLCPASGGPFLKQRFGRRRNIRGQRSLDVPEDLTNQRIQPKATPKVKETIPAAVIARAR